MSWPHNGTPNDMSDEDDGLTRYRQTLRPLIGPESAMPHSVTPDLSDFLINQSPACRMTRMIAIRWL